MKQTLLSLLLMMLPFVVSAGPVEIDGIWYSLDATNHTAEAVHHPNGLYSGNIIIPGNVEYDNVTYTVTSLYATFKGCEDLQSVSLPNTLITIGVNAFTDCSSLSSVTIPNSVITIGDYAFYGCASLTSINIPNGVTSLGDPAFADCSLLTSI